MTPIVNVIGDHATYHRQYDAPLTSDIEGLARPNSLWVKTARPMRTTPAIWRRRAVQSQLSGRPAARPA